MLIAVLTLRSSWRSRFGPSTRLPRRTAPRNPRSTTRAFVRRRRTCFGCVAACNFASAAPAPLSRRASRRCIAASGTLCPAIDQCHGPALCQAGVCNSGPELQCSDGDFCTDDLCDPQQGCVYPQVTGIRLTTCRLDELGALLQSVPADGTAMQRRLARRLDGAAAVLAKLQAATQPKEIRRLRRKARVVLQGFLGAVRRGNRVLGANLERQLERSVKTAISTLTPS